MRCQKGREGENDLLRVTLHLTVAKTCVITFAPSWLASKATFELSGTVINWTDLACVCSCCPSDMPHIPGDSVCVQSHIRNLSNRLKVWMTRCQCTTPHPGPV